MVKFDPVRVWPNEDRCDGGGPPAVSVAPPGSELNPPLAPWEFLSPQGAFDLAGGGGNELCRFGGSPL